MILRLLLFTLAVFAEQKPLAPWFSHGLKPVDIQGNAGVGYSAQDCRGCHTKEYDEWKTSRHSVAWSNKVFQDGFHKEPQERCIYCHAPLVEQLEEILSQKNKFGSFQEIQGNLASEGVNCLACHSREGKIYSSKNSGDRFHPYFKDMLIGKPQFCAGCHQFNFNEVRNGRNFMTGTPVQNTFGEWQKYQRSGGDKSCISCHMPEGKHIFRGAHDLEFLKSALKVELVEEKNETKLKFSSNEVGHDFPTGDLFRYLTVEVKKQKNFQVIQRIGRIYEASWDSESGAFHQKLIADTALKPGKTKTIKLKVTRPFEVRVVYHYTNEKNEGVTNLLPEELTATIYERKFK